MKETSSLTSIYYENSDIRAERSPPGPKLNSWPYPDVPTTTTTSSFKAK